jgi:hypothetical protein
MYKNIFYKIYILKMSSLKKRRKNINIVNKPQQWRSFSVDDIKLTKQNNIKNPIIDGYEQIKNTHKFNETLLRNAYKKPGDWTAVVGDKMAVAGSQTKRDWYDDITKIPFYGDVRKAERYQQLNTALTKHPETKQLIGHSLAGSVILEKQKYQPDLETITYNAPVYQPPPKNSRSIFNPINIIDPHIQKFDKTSTEQGLRYRSTYDPVSAFDWGAKSINTGRLFNPLYSHSYSNNPKNTYASNTILPNNTQILIE